MFRARSGSSKTRHILSGTMYRRNNRPNTTEKSNKKKESCINLFNKNVSMFLFKWDLSKLGCTRQFALYANFVSMGFFWHRFDYANASRCRSWCYVLSSRGHWYATAFACNFLKTSLLTFNEMIGSNWFRRSLDTPIGTPKSIRWQLLFAWTKFEIAASIIALKLMLAFDSFFAWK